jgi:hypothetical protein
MGDPPEGWSRVAVAANEYQAHLIRGALEDEGIKVVLDPFASGAGAYLHAGSDPTAPVRILVPSEQYEAASDVIITFDTQVDTVEPADDGYDDHDIAPEVFAERKAGVPLKVLIAAAVVAAIIVGLTVSELGPLDL